MLPRISPSVIFRHCEFLFRDIDTSEWRKKDVECERLSIRQTSSLSQHRLFPRIGNNRSRWLLVYLNNDWRLSRPSFWRAYSLFADQAFVAVPLWFGLYHPHFERHPFLPPLLLFNCTDSLDEPDDFADYDLASRNCKISCAACLAKLIVEWSECMLVSCCLWKSFTNAKSACKSNILPWVLSFFRSAATTLTDWSFFYAFSLVYNKILQHPSSPSPASSSSSFLHIKWQGSQLTHLEMTSLLFVAVLSTDCLVHTLPCPLQLLLHYLFLGWRSINV